MKKQAIPPDLLEEVFELNMQLEEARMNKKMGEPDRSLDSQLRDTKKQLLAKFEGMLRELHEAWDEWDALIDRAEKAAVCWRKTDSRSAASWLTYSIEGTTCGTCCVILMRYWRSSSRVSVASCQWLELLALSY